VGIPLSAAGDLADINKSLQTVRPEAVLRWSYTSFSPAIYRTSFGLNEIYNRKFSGILFALDVIAKNYFQS
jgi:hypothetical protein